MTPQQPPGPIAPMFGAWTVHLQAIRAFSIHGDPYYELFVIRDEAPEQVTVLRAAAHAIQGSLQPGDRIAITFLMGQVTAVQKM